MQIIISWSCFKWLSGHVWTCDALLLFNKLRLKYMFKKKPFNKEKDKNKWLNKWLTWAKKPSKLADDVPLTHKHSFMFWPVYFSPFFLFFCPRWVCKPTWLRECNPVCLDNNMMVSLCFSKWHWHQELIHFNAEAHSLARSCRATHTAQLVL